MRGHMQKTRKNTVKSGYNAKNRLKIKEKAEILTEENFQKRGNQLKRGTLTPLVWLNICRMYWKFLRHATCYARCFLMHECTYEHCVDNFFPVGKFVLKCFDHFIIILQKSTNYLALLSYMNQVNNCTFTYCLWHVANQCILVLVWTPPCTAGIIH